MTVMSNSKRVSFLRAANVCAFLITVVANSLSNVPGIGEKNVGEISDLYPNLFTPAGYTFSIWGLIYTLLLTFTVFQALPKQREKAFLGRISYLFVLGSIANVSWLFLWLSQQVVLSLVPIFALLSILILIYLRLRIGKSDVPLRERLFVHLPFSVYLGWITVAPIANVAAALTAINWDGWGIGDVTWAVLMVAVATVVTLVVVVTRRDVAYSGIIIWALLGIIVKQIQNQSIVLATAIGIIAILITMIIRARTTR